MSRSSAPFDEPASERLGSGVGSVDEEPDIEPGPLPLDLRRGEEEDDERQAGGPQRTVEPEGPPLPADGHEQRHEDEEIWGHEAHQALPV
jgi:hypothetical protein